MEPGSSILYSQVPACHLSLSSAISIQSIPHIQLPEGKIPIGRPKRRWEDNIKMDILILPSHIRLGLQSGLCPSGFPTTNLYTPLLFPIRATCPVHLIVLDLSSEQYWVKSTDH
jgi:hypothetical protein